MEWLQALLYQQEQATADAIAMAVQQEGGEVGVSYDFTDPDAMGEAMFGETWQDQPIYLDWTTGETIEAPAAKPTTTPAAAPVTVLQPIGAAAPAPVWPILLGLGLCVAGLYYVTR